MFDPLQDPKQPRRTRLGRPARAIVVRPTAHSMGLLAAAIVLSLALALALALVGSAALALGRHGTPARTRRPSPMTRLVPVGRQLAPVGTLVALGNYPVGGALTADGRFLWTVSAGFGNNDVRIVDTVSDRVIQVLKLPGATGGIALDSRHHLAYLSGVPVSRWIPSEQDLPGARGNDVLVFRWSASSGKASFVRSIPVPPQAHAPLLQQYPPIPQRTNDSTPGVTNAWPQNLAVSPDGSRLLVPLNLADSAAVVDLDHADAVRYVPMGLGAYPFAAAIAPGGRTAVVTNEATGKLAVVNMNDAARLASITVGPPLSHPEGVVVNRAGTRAYLALSNSDQVVVVNLRTRRVERTISVGRSAGLGTMPVGVALSPSEDRLFVAESGADELSVVRLPSRSTAAATNWQVVGRIPTASEPHVVLSAAASGTRPQRLIWIAARGFDVGPNSTGPVPTSPTDPIFWAFNPIAPRSDVFDTGAVTYTAESLRGQAGVMPTPSDATVRQLTPAASRQLQPIGAEQAPAGTPLRAGGPIKHVFFIVRENRSYDQMLGDIGRGNSDPKLVVFDRNVTPNMHSMLARFPLLDNVLANSDASVQGHFWTGASIVPDYVSRNWVQQYAGRGRPNDFGSYAVAWPGNGFLFDQAQREHISYFNYGEAFDGGSPSVPDRDRSAAQLKELSLVNAHSDLGPPLTPGGCYPNDGSIGTASATPTTPSISVFDSSLPFNYASTLPPAFGKLSTPARALSHVDCFRARFAKELAEHNVPTLNYLSLTSDHTRGTEPTFRTPSAMVADSDQALGQIVDTVSHSRIWKSSAIFVVEDDSQDGADHLDAHRIPALVISPYANRGGTVHTRYDLPSVLRSIELIIGMKPLTLNDALANPMYDAFSSKPGNSAPVGDIPPKTKLLTYNTPAAPWVQLSHGLPLGKTDAVPQQRLDAILWKSVYGLHSAPPPPGPNAAAGGE
jgi:YVTN family beta-propeller protein